MDQTLFIWNIRIFCSLIFIKFAIYLTSGQEERYDNPPGAVVGKTWIRAWILRGKSKSK
jgi:hypothetical protein